MTLVIVHYHLRPGGVRRVLEQATPFLMARLAPRGGRVVIAAGEANDTRWNEEFAERVAPNPVVWFLDPAFGYLSEQARSPAAASARITDAVERLFASLDSSACIVWAHNFSVGRNMLLTRALGRACAAQKIPFVLHHHDWWFEHRWQRWPEIQGCGFRSVRAVAEAVFPATPNARHIAINRADAGVLRQHFGRAAAWIPNITEPVSPPSEPRVAMARRWLRHRLGGPGPVWLTPCRVLRRKNLAEALLLTRWLRPQAWLITTAAASSDDERPYAAGLAAAARRHRWKFRLGLLARGGGKAPPVRDLMAASEAVLLTSIQEGFGLPSLEAAAAGRPVIARRLPNVTPDFAALGFRFAQSYGELLIHPDLFDWENERRRQQRAFARWAARLPAGWRQWAGTAHLLDRRGRSPVPLSRLTLAGQLEVLAHPAPHSWRLCAPLNPFLATWRRRAVSGRLIRTRWPNGATRALHGAEYANRFAALLRSKARPGPGAAHQAQSQFLRRALAAANQFPLLWSVQVQKPAFS